MWRGSIEKPLDQQWLAARGTFPIQQSAELEGAYLQLRNSIEEA